MSIIGVTGNSGSGKSTFSKILAKKLNAEIINADEIAKKASEKGEEYYNQIVKYFGNQILIGEKLNRKKLAEIIYKDSEKRKILNLLTEQYIVKKIKDEILKNKNLIIDVPLLFEMGLEKSCNVTISLLANREIKIKRMCERDNIDKSIAQQRLNIQETDDFYMKKSNYVIVNDNADLEKEANEFIEIMNKNNFLNDEIIITKSQDVKYIQFKRLLENKNIVHCFTLKPMDFGDNATYEIKKEIVENSYKKIGKVLNINYENIIRPYQTHTNNIKKVISEKGIYNEEFKNVDGIITNQKERVLSLTFADCTPIYFFDKEKNAIGLVHSGWVGTTKKIVKNAIEKMQKEYNCKAKDLICAIGPSIRQCHFEVDEDVKNIFYDEFKHMKDINEIIRQAKNSGKYYIDTAKINKNMLIEEGVLEKNIIDCNICTLCNHELVYSYRKDGKKAGRNTAILCLK